ncbi:MAG: hypothetical protein MUF81_01205 [Verrucomicrobia bacterium]|nr:hypothetical protein [Verrucomicrobiota bacterium]
MNVPFAVAASETIPVCFSVWLTMNFSLCCRARRRPVWTTEIAQACGLRVHLGARVASQQSPPDEQISFALLHVQFQAAISRRTKILRLNLNNALFCPATLKHKIIAALAVTTLLLTGQPGFAQVAKALGKS